MEDIYEKILWDGYGLRYRGGSRTRSGLVCRTDAGLRELKKPRGNAENLRLAYDVKARLRQNGFPSVSRLYPAQDGGSRFIEKMASCTHWRTPCLLLRWLRKARRIS